MRYLEHGEEGKETSDQATNSGVAGSGSTGKLGGGRGGGIWPGDVAGRKRSLGLTVADLGNDWANRLGCRCLRLSIRDLRNNDARGRPGGRCLGLSVGNLGDNDARGRPGARSLGLTVGDLRDDRRGAGRGSLRLAVGDLGNGWWLSDLRLAIADLRSTTTGTHSYNIDRDALCTCALTVQVVKGTRLALVEYSRRSTATRGEREGTVAADGETSGFTSTCLKR